MNNINAVGGHSPKPRRRPTTPTPQPTIAPRPEPTAIPTPQPTPTRAPTPRN